MHRVFALLCFVVVIHWLIFPYPSGLLHWHCGNLTSAPVPAKQAWWIWMNTSCEFILNDCITTTKQSTTKPCAYFLGYTVYMSSRRWELLRAMYIYNSSVEIPVFSNGIQIFRTQMLGRGIHHMKAFHWTTMLHSHGLSCFTCSVAYSVLV